MLKDLGHPFADGQPVYDVTFENVQAGERTSHLFRLANFHHGLVVGTGDLSELALGWATFGVGDHMSHYNVNASVPKTLIQHVIRWVADSGQLGSEVTRVLPGILATEISPELVPGSDDGPGPAQSTEAIIGPYSLNDFFLYYLLRFGFGPARVAFLAACAWADRETGGWPGVPVEQRQEYSLATIKQHLDRFLYRFFELSQYKRSTLPNGPKVGSGGSLSPRGDWRAPSDAESAIWRAQLELIPDEADIRQCTDGSAGSGQPRRAPARP
jgi:NAD+ synthase (glutamine-hydrolysing)